MIENSCSRAVYFEPNELGATFGLQQLLKFNKFQKIRNSNFNFHQKFFLR